MVAKVYTENLNAVGGGEGGAVCKWWDQIS